MPTSQELMNKYRAKYESLKRKMGTHTSFYLMKAGKIRIRILPDESDVFFRDAAMHHLEGSKRLIWCQAACGHGDCYICEQLSRLEETGRDINRCKARARNLANVIIRGEDTNPHAFVMPPSVLKEVLAYVDDPDYGDPTDIKNGFDIDVDRTGTGIETEYSVRARPQRTPAEVDKKLLAEILKARIDLSQSTKMDEDDLKKIWAEFARSGSDEDSIETTDDVLLDSVEDEQEEVPVTPKRKPLPSKPRLKQR